MNQTVTFRIDGKDLTSGKDRTLLEAARDAGVYIPTLCYRDESLAPGACRLCTVKVDGRYAAACKTTVSEGAEVENNTPQLQEMRKQLIEAIFVEGNHFCPSCEKSGSCELQALAYRMRILAPRFEYRWPERDIEARPRKLIIERNRCILCKRCVHGIFTEDGERIFTLSNRGTGATISVDIEKADTMDDEAAQRAMDICPVGSILRKRRGYAEPIGTRRFDTTEIGSDVELRITRA